MKRGLFIDFDGTLVNSISQLKRSYFEFMSLKGCNGTLDEFNQLNGPPLHEIIAALKQKYSWKEPTQQLLETYQQVIETNEPELAPSNGVEQLIETALSLQFTLAIVTSSPTRRVSKWLQNNDLEMEFSFVIGAESTDRGKPHPDPYRLALALLDVPPQNAIAIEDSASGATSALEAGIVTILVNHEHVNIENPLLVQKRNLADAARYLEGDA